MIELFILIYLVSLVIHIIMCYRENKYVIHKIGDLIDLIEFYMWVPIINTILVIVAIIGSTIIKICQLLKLDILWEKFRNIKLR